MEYLQALETVFMMQAGKRGMEEKSCKCEQTLSQELISKEVNMMFLFMQKYTNW